MDSKLMYDFERNLGTLNFSSLEAKVMAIMRAVEGNGKAYILCEELFVEIERQGEIARDLHSVLSMLVNRI